MTENTKQKRFKLKEVCLRLTEGYPLYSDVPLSNPGAALDVMRREMSRYDREVLCVVKNIWQNVRKEVPNTELKGMVESYKTRAPQARSGQTGEAKESAMAKLDALVKDTSVKVSPDRPKAKASKAKGPEL